MPGENPIPSNLTRLVSIPGIIALAVFGILIIGISRLFGPEAVLREVVVEVIASLGSAILLLAVFALLFRSGIERLVRRAPGGDLYAQSNESLRELLEDLDVGQNPQLEERLARIEEKLESLADEHVPDLKNEIRELRSMILDSRRERDA